MRKRTDAHEREVNDKMMISHLKDHSNADEQHGATHGAVISERKTSQPSTSCRRSFLLLLAFFNQYILFLQPCNI